MSEETKEIQGIPLPDGDDIKPQKPDFLSKDDWFDVQEVGLLWLDVVTIWQWYSLYFFRFFAHSSNKY